MTTLKDLLARSTPASHRNEPGADKFPVGSRVEVLGNGRAEVLRHGRDLLGDYTEVRHDDGTIRHYHRNWWLTPWLKPVSSSNSNQ